jgi:hypothetical protein
MAEGPDKALAQTEGTRLETHLAIFYSSLITGANEATRTLGSNSYAQYLSPDIMSVEFDLEPLTFF